MPFDLGGTVRLMAECRGPDGTLTTASSAVLTVTLPDGTTALPAVEETDAVGIYRGDYVPTVVGRHTLRWVFTAPAAALTDVFDVRPEVPTAILSHTDARAHLNLRSSQDDDEVRFWNAAATRAVEAIIGPVVARQVVEDHLERESRSIALRHVPVLEVLAVEALHSDGQDYDVVALVLDEGTGTLTRYGGGLIRGPLRITYRAGRSVIAENITAGARIILEHLWRTQRSARGGLAGGGDDYSVTEPIPGLGYAIPNRALQLLEADRLPPGVA
ncbi:hypothetical protein ACF06T_28800 [Streptomyces albidoflavus]